MRVAGNRRFAGLLAAIALGALAAVIASGSGDRAPRFVPGGGEVATVLTPRASKAAKPPAHIPRFSPSPAALAFAARMPLARQVAQLFLVTVHGKKAADVAALGSSDWGGIVFDASNFEADAQVSVLAGQAIAGARSAGNTPPLLAATQEGGANSAFPDLPPAPEPDIGAAGRPAAARAQALLAGRRLRTLGFNMTLAPLADVDIPGGPLSGRLFGSNPAKVAHLSAAAVSGYLQASMIAAVGHFPGSGGASADPDQMSATVGGSLAELRAHDLIPFAAVVAQAPVIVMSNATYAALDGVTPASLSAAAVRLLRRDYGFPGVVMSDDLDATLQATGQDAGSAALDALKAGDDLIYISGGAAEREAAYEAILRAAQGSSLLRARIRDAVIHDLSLKARFRILP